MSVKMKMLLLFGIFLLCVMVINQFIFPLGWTCSCFSEDAGRYQCRVKCGSEPNCDGWSWDSEGMCYLGWCYVDGWVLCSDTGPQDVVFVDIECMDCNSPGW